MPVSFQMFVAVLFIGLLTCSAAVAQVDDDDDDFYSSSVDFQTPTALVPDTQYSFSFLAVNRGIPSYYSHEWFNQVDLILPSEDYILDEINLVAPNPLHPADVQMWEVEYDYNNTMISWMTVSGQTSSEDVGDIRESESLLFEFVATTDSVATDGFLWWLTSDQGTVLNGISYIGSGPVTDDDDAYDDDDNGADDDDIDADDDDDNDFISSDSDDGSDDEDSDGCGC